MTVDLKKTASVGRFLPIVLNEEGEIVDGEHRKSVDPTWPTLKTRIAPGLETHVARLIINSQRRTASSVFSYPASFEIIENNGRYSEITMPPMVMPRMPMMIGSSIASMSLVAASTSSS